MKRSELRALIESIKNVRKNATDETALESIAIYAEWKPEIDYAIGDRIRFNNVLYKCVQAHTSQKGWEPDITPALWTMVSIEEWPEWIQPTGVQDSYSNGDKVSHNNRHWISTCDNNVWEPGVYGWEEVL